MLTTVGTASVSLSATTILIVDTGSLGNTISSSNIEGTDSSEAVMVIGRLLPGPPSQSNVEELAGVQGVEQQDLGEAQVSKEQELGGDQEQHQQEIDGGQEIEGDQEGNAELVLHKTEQTEEPIPPVPERSEESANGDEADDYRVLPSTDSVFLHESQTQLHPHNKEASSNRISRRISICLDGVLILDTHIAAETTETSAQGSEHEERPESKMTQPTTDAPDTDAPDAAKIEAAEREQKDSTGEEQDQSLYKVPSEFLEVPTTRLSSPEPIQH